MGRGNLWDLRRRGIGSVAEGKNLFRHANYLNSLATKNDDLSFGEGWHKQQVAVHKRESEIVEKMQSLRSNGLTFRDIAKALNSLGTQTKNRKGIWFGKQIHQILKKIKQELVVFTLNFLSEIFFDFYIHKY